MSDFNNKEARIKNALDNRKLSLSATCPTSPQNKSSLSWSIIGNNPRCTIYTNDPEDNGQKNDYGRIVAKLDLAIFMMYMNLIDRVIKAPPDTKFGIKNENFKFPNGKRTDAPVLENTLWVGKDKDGIMWLSVVDANKSRPVIKFPFVPSNFHHFIHGDGTPFTAAETSVLFAEGYRDTMARIMTHLAVTEYKEPPPKNQQGGGGGQYNRGGGDRGGYNNNRGGGGGGGYNNQRQAAPELEDDALPF